MNTFKGACLVFLKKPISMIAFSFVVLMYCIAEHSVLFPLAISIFTTKGQNVLSNMAYIMMLALNMGTHIEANYIFVLKLLAGIIFASVFVGFILSGYLNVICKVVSNEELNMFDFFEGLKRYFLKMWVISLKVIFVILIYSIMLIISVLPAILFTFVAIGGNKNLFWPAIFTDILTIVVLFASYIFLVAYISCWYVAVLNVEKKCFANAWNIVDSFFGKISKNIIGYSLLFVSVELILMVWQGNVASYYSKNELIGYIAIVINWLLKTFIITAYLSKILHIAHIRERTFLIEDEQ